MNIKQLCKLGALALAFCSLQAMAQSGPRVVIGSGSDQVGSTTPMVITLDFFTEPTVIGIQGDINFDSANLTVDISSCGGSIGGATITCSNPSAGVVRYVGFDTGLNPLPDGSFGTLSFDISSAVIADYPLTVSGELYGDASEGDVPSTGSTDGLVSVNAGPQPVFASMPDAATGVTISGQISTTIQVDVVINNDGGQDGSTLTYSCTETADPDGKFTISGDITDVAVAKGGSGTVTVACNSSAIGGPHTGEMQCTHNGTNASPVTYALSCTVTAGPEPAFNGMAAGIAMVADEQGDPDPSGSVTITNTGDDGTTLSGTCSLAAGDAQISMSNGAFSIVAGAAGHVVGVSCDASAEGSYVRTLSCSHNGTNVATPVDYSVTCDVGPPGPAVYSSAPAPGAVIAMTTDDVPVGAVVPDQVLTITNAAAEANDRDLLLSGCGWTGSAEITATDPTSPVAAQASTSVTFSCSTAAVGAYTGTYSCDYNEDGGESIDGTASYTVNCGVRAAASDIDENPTSGTALRFVVPVNGTGQTSVSFAEILDEGVDGTIDSCSMADGSILSVVTTLPATVAAGASVSVTVEGSDPFDGSTSVTDTLTCIYEDSVSGDPVTVSWPITMTIQTAAIPTLSSWGLMLMILTMLGLGGIVIRRKTFS